MAFYGEGVDYVEVVRFSPKSPQFSEIFPNVVKEVS